MLFAILVATYLSSANNIPDGQEGEDGLGSWEWALGNFRAPSSDWQPAKGPFARIGGSKEVVVWFRTSLPAWNRDEPPAILLDYSNHAFEVRIENKSIFSFDGSKSSYPWHIVPLPANAAGKPILIRVTQIPDLQGTVGFTWGIRVGTRSDFYLSILREEWLVAAAGIMLLLGGVIAFVAHTVSRIRRQARPYAALSALCLTNGFWIMPQHGGHLVGLFYSNQDVLDLINFIAGCAAIAADLWYVRAVFQQRRPAVMTFSWVVIAYGLIVGVAKFTGLFSVIGQAQAGSLFTIISSLVILHIVWCGWRTASRSLRLTSFGLVFYEVFQLLDQVSATIHVFGIAPAWSHVGFGGYLVFLFFSTIIFSIEAREVDALKEVRNARARIIAQTTAMFAHDVRTPFAVMRATLGSLQNANTLEEVRELLTVTTNEIRDVSQSVDEMITDILDLSSGAEPHVQDDELRPLIDSVLKKLQRVYKPRNIRLSVNLTHSWKVAVQRTKIERVISNIVCNALEVMQCNDTIWICSSDVANSRFVQVTIGNSGSFISENDRERIFEPFVSTGKRGGTGLGLAIVKNIIQSHGGSIRVEADRQRGVEFIFTVPASSQRTEIVPFATLATVSPVSPAFLTKQPQVILVEDSLAIRKAWRKKLPPGVLRDFESPTQCLEAVESEPPLFTDALYVILDNRFAPGEMDGTNLGAILRTKTQARIFLYSGVPVEPLPKWCNGQLPKETFDLEGLARAFPNS